MRASYRHLRELDRGRTAASTAKGRYLHASFGRPGTASLRNFSVSVRVFRTSSCCALPTNIWRSGGVMDPRDWPLDPVVTAALVVRVVEELDRSDEDQRDAL